MVAVAVTMALKGLPWRPQVLVLEKIMFVQNRNPGTWRVFIPGGSAGITPLGGNMGERPKKEKERLRMYESWTCRGYVCRLGSKVTFCPVGR